MISRLFRPKNLNFAPRFGLFTYTTITPLAIYVFRVKAEYNDEIPRILRDNCQYNIDNYNLGRKYNGKMTSKSSLSLKSSKE